MVCGRLIEHCVCLGAPIISHLLFVEDTAVFGKVDKAQVDVVESVLDTYVVTSGQQINYDKTQVMFSEETSQSINNSILIKLDIWEVLSYDKYLGLLTRVSRSKKKPFLPIKDRTRKRLNGWMDRHLFWAGRKVLIKVVA